MTQRLLCPWTRDPGALQPGHCNQRQILGRGGQDLAVAADGKRDLTVGGQSGGYCLFVKVSEEYSHDVILSICA